MSDIALTPEQEAEARRLADLVEIIQTAVNERKKGGTKGPA